MVFHWSLSRSPRVFKTLLTILAVIDNAVVWMVSNFLLSSKSSTLITNPLEIVPRALITIGITFIIIISSSSSSSVLVIMSFSIPVVTDDFYWSLNDHKSSHRSRNLLGIQAKFNIILVWTNSSSSIFKFLLFSFPVFFFFFLVGDFSKSPDNDWYHLHVRFIYFF